MISWSSQIDNNSSKGKAIISAIDAAPKAGCIGFLSSPVTAGHDHTQNQLMQS